MGKNEKLPQSFKHCELVLYEDSWAVPDGQTLPEWLTALTKTRAFEFATARHDKDEKKVHWHVMLRFPKPWRTADIKAKFKVQDNQIGKMRTGRFGDALSYLTHANTPDKYQYDSDEVYANFDWQDERRIGIAERIHKCSTGEIRQYNYTDYFSDSEYMKNERKIRQAFKYRSDYVMQHLEEQVEKRDVVWIYGEAGTGKTTFAKRMAAAADYAFRITSTGKNMFDEYRDEPCLIIDDIRPDKCGFDDLLGILDPFNSRAISSRYVNKANQAEMIMITCPYSPEEFYRKCGVEEPAAQLYRRINTLFHMTDETVYEYVWDGVVWSEKGRYSNVFALAARKHARESEKISELRDKAFKSFAESGF